MLFNSARFVVFFPTVCFAYFWTPQRWRWVTLLVASCVFYMAFIPAYILVLFGLILVDYAAALAIDASAGGRRRAMLAVSLVTNIGILVVFKYYNVGGWVLPLGLSFHTFQSMAYTIEVYRGHFPAERHLGRYALYVMFFPQLVAGPIERPVHLLPQFLERHHFDPDRATHGLKLMAWGLFKKIAIADRLSSVVDAVYTVPASQHGPSVALATVFFAAQIYCDFSGYTDIAIGCAEVLGFRLVTNFRRPYLARSIREFWWRWHISLSTWFRDYLYIPLGGNRVSLPRWACNILITFLISGLWHGANWTFVVWGGLHGCYLLAGRATEHLRDRVRPATTDRRASWPVRAMQTAFTFLLVCVGWVFFRAASVGDAFTLLSRLADWSTVDFVQNSVSLLISATLIVALYVIEASAPNDDVTALLTGAPGWIRWSTYYGVVTATLLFGVFNQSRFIYFQF